MGFFGIGGWEILLILVVALIIWGPDKLPEIARKLGKTVRAFKKASFDLTNAVTKEIEKETGLSTQPGKSPGSKTGELSPDTGDAKAGHGKTTPRKPIKRQQQ